MTDAPMKIEARFDAALLDDLRRDNARLREALTEIETLLDCGNIEQSHWDDCLSIARAALAAERGQSDLSDLAPTETHGKP